MGSRKWEAGSGKWEVGSGGGGQDRGYYYWPSNPRLTSPSPFPPSTLQAATVMTRMTVCRAGSSGDGAVAMVVLVTAVDLDNGDGDGDGDGDRDWGCG